MNHEASASSLIRQTMKFVEEDRKKSWTLFLTTLLLVLISFTFALSASHIWLRYLSGVLAGLFLSRLFVIYHDYNHKAILTKSMLADGLMTVLGLFALAPRSIWNHVHNHHHDHNSQFTDIVLGSFPILDIDRYKSMSRAARTKYLILRHPVTIGLSYLSVFIISFCLYPFFESPKKHWDGLLSFLLHSLLIVLIWFSGGVQAVIPGIVLPFTIMGALGGYVFYAQHNFPGVKLMSKEDWSYERAALESSSFIRMNRVWSWITANVGYHHVHHVNARIPFYRLPEAMNKIPTLQQPTETTLSFNDIAQCLSLKLWDSERQRMIKIKDLH